MPDHLRPAKEEPKAKKKQAPKPRKPRKGARRTEELWYEMKGEDPPWKQKHENPT